MGLWWKDIVEMEVLKSTSWFHSNVERENGEVKENTNFWKDIWVGNAPISISFPHVFSISTQNVAKVGDLFGGEGFHGRGWNVWVSDFEDGWLWRGAV